MLNYQTMNTNTAASLFEALSSPIRLNIFKLLVRFGDAGLIAGDIASQLDVPSTNLSFHLKGLLHVGLVSVEQEGRFMRYRANIPLMLEIVEHLTEQCCANQPEQCLAYRSASPLAHTLFAGPQDKKL